MKVLVVDDSTVMRMIVKKALKEMGAEEIDEATDGAEAVTAAASSEYDLILMDWNMPNMLGIEAVKAIRAKGNKVPIIMVTTEAEKSRVVEAVQAGASSYVVKPFEPETLAEKVKSVLEKVS